MQIVKLFIFGLFLIALLGCSRETLKEEMPGGKGTSATATSYSAPEIPATIQTETAVPLASKVPATIQTKTNVPFTPEVPTSVKENPTQSTPESTTSVEFNHKTIEDKTRRVDVKPEFTITSSLCQDEYGPTCSKLRLGDNYLTTSKPEKGYLYSCNEKNPSAPGSIESRITWIDFANNTWDFLKKLWLPGGDFDPGPGLYSETLSGANRQINSNNLPVDRKIGDWPMTDYPSLTEIDRNPGIPSSTSISYSYPIEPIQSLSPNCVSLGAIGITKNGVVIYNAVDGRGEDAVAREIIDIFGGHPAQSDYHYHFIPERLDNEPLSDGHSGIVGYINDGFPIYGYRGIGGIEMSNDDLDLCHGHEHSPIGYHYHATLEYPYTVGCYMGSPTSRSHAQTQQRRQGESAQGRPPPRR